MTAIKRLCLSTASCAAMALAIATSAPAFAQDVPPPSEEAVGEPAADENIVVTGSRIRRTDLEAPVPITAVDSQELESSGFTNLTEAIADLPGAGLGDTVIGTPNGTIQSAGTTSVNLRNLGSNRTLTLIDGRRTVSNAANRNVVSLNTIPIDFVERVEIITGAASAIYGSDAVAGVVNIITESNLQGLRLKARSGLTFEGGGEEYSLSATYGRRFADDRGHLLLSASYEDDRGLYATDRAPRATRNRTFDPGDNETTEPDLSSDISGGRFRGSEFFYDETGLRRTFVTAQHGYNDRPFDTLRVPRDVLALAGKLRFEVSDAFRPFATVMFADLDTNYSRAPIGVRNDTESTIRDPTTGLPLLPLQRFSPGRIPRNSALIPAEILPRVQSTGLDFRRRMDEVGNREFINDRDTLRVYAGFNGNFMDGWFYEASYGYGDFKQDQVRTGNVNLLNLQRGLDVELFQGQLRCRSAEARADGCVPVNIFGVGSMSPEAADYIRADTFLKSHIQQHVVQAYTTGTIFDLPAGSVSFAGGVEYREDSSSLATDDEVRTGFTTASGVPSFDEKITVKEAFAEFTIPIVKDRPGFENLSIDIAGRVSDYSLGNVGTVFSYRFGASYVPVPGLRFRGQYGTAQRAPDLAEVYSPPRDDNDTTLDPCDGVRVTTAGTLAANCRAEPGIAAAIAAAGVYEQETDNLNSPNAGNLSLKEETARTITLGAVLSPPGIPGLNLSFDYYRIKIKDAIDAYDAFVILDQCYNDADFPNNDFCPEIVRNNQNGQIQQIIQRQQNLNRTTVSGFDVHLDYRFDLDRLVNLPGRIELRADWSHEIENETLFTAVGGVLELDDDLGEIAFPQDQVRARIGYELGGAEIQWRTRWLGPAVATNERVQQAEEDGIANPLFLRYGDYWRHDIYASFRARSWANMRFYAGINNLFNNAGPDVPEGATPEAVGGFIPTYGVVGRTGYVGVELKF